MISNETWQETLIRYRNTDKSKAWGYRPSMKFENFSSNEIKSLIDSNLEKKVNMNNDDNDLIYAVEALDAIIAHMVFNDIKSTRFYIEHRYQCRVLIVSLAIKRGLNAEICKKNTEYVIVDCF